MEQQLTWMCVCVCVFRQAKRNEYHVSVLTRTFTLTPKAGILIKSTFCQRNSSSCGGIDLLGNARAASLDWAKMRSDTADCRVVCAYLCGSVCGVSNAIHVILFKVDGESICKYVNGSHIA